MLNTHKKWKGTWPFTVDQVAVLKLDFKQLKCFALVHKYKIYALSGALDNNFHKLEESGIWKDEQDHKKSLTPFFDFIEWQSKRMK